MDLKKIAFRLASRTPVEPRRRAFGSSPFDLISVAVRIAGMESVSYVKKEKGKYCVKSEHNPDWSGGCYDTKEEANERLRQVEAAKHAKAAAPKRPARPLPPSQRRYKDDEEVRKELKGAPLPKRPPSDPPPRNESDRDASSPEYEDVDAFANFLYDSGLDEFDHIDLQFLNERTRTPIKELQADLEGYGLSRKERAVEKKTRGISDNPHGTPPFAGMSGGAAYQSVLDSKYGRNPFEEA